MTSLHGHRKMMSSSFTHSHWPETRFSSQVKRLRVETHVSERAFSVQQDCVCWV